MANVKKNVDMPKISIRLDPDVKDQIDFITSKIDPQVNRSQIIRDAIALWLNVKFNQIFYPPAELCIISKNLLKMAFDAMSPVELEQMAKKAVFNSEKWKNLNLEEYRNSRIDLKFKAKEDTLEGYLEILINRVYSSKGYDWFDTIQYRIEADQLVFKGTHRLGHNFNQFIQYHLKYHLQRFGYDISRLKSSYIEEEDNSLFDLEITMKKKNKKSENEK
ncbi:MAG: hypothetical protein ACTSYI_18065 [Promethearchaeota archaeon]